MRTNGITRLERVVVGLVVFFALLAFAATFARGEEITVHNFASEYGIGQQPSNFGQAQAAELPEAPETAEDVLRQADEMFKNRRFNDSEKLYIKYISEGGFQKNQEDTATAYYRLGLIARKRQQYQKAQDYLILAMKTDSSQSLQITFDYAEILYNMGEYVRAGSLFQYLMEKEPQNKQASHFYGLSLLKRGMFRQSYPVLLDAIGQEQACRLIGAEAKSAGNTLLAEEMDRVVEQIYLERDRMFFIDPGTPQIANAPSQPPVPSFAAQADLPSTREFESAEPLPAATDQQASKPLTAGYPLSEQTESTKPFESFVPTEPSVPFEPSMPFESTEPMVASVLNVPKEPVPIPPTQPELPQNIPTESASIQVESPVSEMIAAVPTLVMPQNHPQISPISQNVDEVETGWVISGATQEQPVTEPEILAPTAQIAATPEIVSTPEVPAPTAQIAATPEIALPSGMPASPVLPIVQPKRTVSVEEPSASPFGPNESFVLAAVTPSLPESGVSVVDSRPSGPNPEAFILPGAEPIPNVALTDMSSVAPFHTSASSVQIAPIDDSAPKMNSYRPDFSGETIPSGEIGKPESVRPNVVAETAVPNEPDAAVETIKQPPRLTALLLPAFAAWLQVPPPETVSSGPISDNSTMRAPTSNVPVSNIPAATDVTAPSGSPANGAQEPFIAARPSEGCTFGSSHPGLTAETVEPVGIAQTFVASRPSQERRKTSEEKLAEAVAAGATVEYLTPEEFKRELATRAGSIVQSTREEAKKIRSSQNLGK